MIAPLDPWYHAHRFRHHSAGLKRWPEIRTVRAATAAGLRKWTPRDGPYRTRRAAMRAARRLRDASGIRYEWEPGAQAWGVYREAKGRWIVMSRAARGKSDPTAELDVKDFDAALKSPPF